MGEAANCVSRLQPGAGPIGDTDRCHSAKYVKGDFEITFYIDLGSSKVTSELIAMFGATISSLKSTSIRECYSAAKI